MYVIARKGSSALIVGVPYLRLTLKFCLFVFPFQWESRYINSILVISYLICLNVVNFSLQDWLYHSIMQQVNTFRELLGMPDNDRFNVVLFGGTIT